MDGIVITGGQVETLRRLDTKTMDAVVGAAVRIMLGDDVQVNVPDKLGIVEALARSIAEASQKHEDEKLQKREYERLKKRNARARKTNVPECPSMSLNVPECPSMSPGHLGTSGDKEKEKEKRKEAKEIKKENREGNPHTPKGGFADLGADDGDRPITDRPSTLRGGESGDRPSTLRGGESGDRPSTLRGGETGRSQIGHHHSHGSESGQEGGGANPGHGGMQADERGRRIEAAARAMADAHPNPAGLDGFPRTLGRYLDKNPGATLREIVEAHGRWLADADAWRDGYAPKLKNWLWGGDWRRAPPKKKPPPGGVGEEIFECGASL